MNKRFFISLLFLFFFAAAALSQQLPWSISTDVGLLRSFKKDQRFWAIGHILQAHIHFTPKEGAYSWISYYSVGKFSNDLTATAKLPSTTPQQINYVNNAEMRFKQFSLGWKHYFIGASDVEDNWSLYGYAGFGLLMGRIVNTHSVTIDTTLYNVPVLSGEAHFKRLTLDLGLGWEVPIGGDIFFYNEGKVLIPTTDYPSKYLFVNNNAPLVATVNIGIRVLF